MPDNPTLSKLMSQSRQGDELVGVDRNGPVTWQAFSHRVQQWYTLFAQTPGESIGLFMEDACSFAAALIAIWHTDKYAYIPGDTLPDTMRQLATAVDALAGDFPPADRIRRLQNTDAEEISPPSYIEFHPLDTARLAAILLTSGSTGTPKPVRVTLQQFETEVQMHERCWGNALKDAPVIGTVSHQHLYGLIFRVLWPLAACRPFVAQNIHYLESLNPFVREWGRLSLVTTPSHLNRLPPNMAWDKIRGRWAAIFSSTAPLDRNASLAARDLFGQDVTEIFGSTETGGIAWRQQNKHSAWQLFDGIRATSDRESGALRLCSPLLPDENWVETADRVEFIDDRHFHLLGRLDRIAKIEGKRVSLTAVEKHLLEHEWVVDARAVVIEARRTELGVVAELSPEGRQQLASGGKRMLSRMLRNHLKGEFEAPTLPRRWRFPTAMPRNAQGKITAQQLTALFSTPPRANRPEDGGN